MKKKDYAKRLKMSPTEPYTSNIALLQDYLNQQKVTTPRNIRFERTDIQRMFRSDKEQLFTLDLTGPKYRVIVNLAGDKTKDMSFNSPERLLLWFYRRLETTYATLKTASVDDAPTYQAMIDQMIAASDQVKPLTNVDIK